MQTRADDPPFTVSRDIPTLIAIAIVAYALSNFAHEGLGHGGACLLVHCSPHLVSSMQFDGDMTQISSGARRFIAAGGTLVNLLVAAISFVSWRRSRADSAWFFFWLLTTISLLQATGYLLFSGLGNVGDWAVVVEGWRGSLAWHVGLALIGGATYWLATRWAMKNLGARLHATTSIERTRAAYRYTLIAYLAGGALYLLAGSFDPAGLVILLISGVAASFGGTSGLAWGPQLLKSSGLTTQTSTTLTLRRDWRWIAFGSVCAIVYVAVLGPGVRF
jgi:hypothetical protein